MVRALSSLDLNHGAVIHPFFANPISGLLADAAACWCLRRARHALPAMHHAMVPVARRAQFRFPALPSPVVGTLVLGPPVPRPRG